jgi:molecular chaperone GrpE
MFKHKEEDNKPSSEEKSVTLSDSEYLNLKTEAEKAKDYYERMLRLQADFENAKKRMERETNDFYSYANQEIIIKLLNILDDLERVVDAAEKKQEDFSVFLKGVEMILAHLYDLLKDNGVRPIDAQGKKFDPHLHEALMQVESSADPDETIVEELQKGYFLKDRVIRTTKAKVSTQKSSNDNQEMKKVEIENKEIKKENNNKNKNLDQ